MSVIATLAAHVGSRQTQAAAAACFHCGQPCAETAVVHGKKSFCCNSCLTVHDLLLANGLGHFYDLSESPGVRRSRTSEAKHWTYLDQTEVTPRLLDFTDTKISRVTFHTPDIHCVACVWLLEN